MADGQEKKGKAKGGALEGAARAIGSVVGKVASATGIATPEKEAAKPQPENLYAAEYLGSGTFIFKKPTRQNAKLRQSRLKGTVRGARK